MIYIVHKNLTTSDKQSLVFIFSHIKIDESLIKFIDLSCEDLDINNKDYIFALGTYREVAKALVSSGAFRSKDLLGSDVIDDVTNFCFINLPYVVTDILTNSSTKAIVWKKLQAFSTLFESMRSAKIIQSEKLEALTDEPFNDELPTIEELSRPAIAESHSSLVDDNNSITLNPLVLLNDLIRNMDTSEASLGKTLSLSEKITFTAQNITVCVYPNNRISSKDVNSSDTLHISFKDLMAILKCSIMFDAEKISFFKSKE